jgi:hypothetical protein
MHIKNELEQLEYNINLWSKIVKQQEKIILQNYLLDDKSDYQVLPFHWEQYTHAQEQLERVKAKFGTTEVFEIKDLYR